MIASLVALYVFERRKMSATGSDLKKYERKTMIVAVVCSATPIIAIAALLSFLQDWFAFIGFLLIVGAYAVVIRIYQKQMQGEPGPIVCAKCGYPRPEEEANDNRLCPECGNRWWQSFNKNIAVYWRKGATYERSYRVMHQRWYWLLPIMVTALVYVAGGPLQRTFYRHAPVGTLIWLVSNGGDSMRAEAYKELFVNRTIPQSVADAFMDDIVNERNKPARLPYGLGREFEQALQSGVFSKAALDRFYGESIQMTLEAVVSEDGMFVEPRVITKEYANTIYVDPDVVSPGFQINGGSYHQPVTGLCSADWFSYAHEDYFVIKNGKPLYDRESPGEHYYGYKEHPIAGLPPGTHTITARVHLYVLPSLASTHGHQFFGPGGTITPHPQAIWHETRDISTTFTIPASSR